MATEQEIRKSGAVMNEAAEECARDNGDIVPGMLLGMLAMLMEIACQLAIMNERADATAKEK